MQETSIDFVFVLLLVPWNWNYKCFNLVLIGWYLLEINLITEDDVKLIILKVTWYIYEIWLNLDILANVTSKYLKLQYKQFMRDPPHVGQSNPPFVMCKIWILMHHRWQIRQSHHGEDHHINFCSSIAPQTLPGMLANCQTTTRLSPMMVLRFLSSYQKYKLRNLNIRKNVNYVIYDMHVQYITEGARI